MESCLHQTVSIVIGGEAPTNPVLQRILHGCSFLIAADSGFDTVLDAGLEPDLVIGDMDSLVHRESLRKMDPDRVIKYPKEKDFSDTELAIQFALERGATELLILGGGGGRLDHTLSIIHIVSRLSVPVFWITKYDELFMLFPGQTSLAKMKDRRVSFTPLGQTHTVCNSQGLAWDLKDVIWQEMPMSLSNVGIQETVTVTVQEGSLLCIVELTENHRTQYELKRR
ncbi:thiamine diphosphokinase [Spirochaeta lutea]|uniref:thiamine diphosphokinase n=1 Tax=Spirochaeta lutea TaxID=1480694 RepID=UPI0009DCF624|nr:thiamine diphosphokinase [Spirochaeta lutea]